MDSYAKRVAVNSVFWNNNIRADKHTETVVENALTSNDPQLPVPPPEWPSDGGRDENGKAAQLRQYAQAHSNLFSVPAMELSSAVLKQTHKFMMWGTDADPGEYRNTAAHSEGTTHRYPPPEEVPGRVEGVLSTFRSNLQRVLAGEMDMEVMIAALFYGLVNTHPFKDGNGRLCRLLVGYALQAAGEPFPVYLDNGHSKARGQFMTVLRGAHNQGISKLAAFIVECRCLAWQSCAKELRGNA